MATEQRLEGKKESLQKAIGEIQQHNGRSQQETGILLQHAQKSLATVEHEDEPAFQSMSQAEHSLKMTICNLEAELSRLRQQHSKSVDDTRAEASEIISTRDMTISGLKDELTYEQSRRVDLERENTSYRQEISELQRQIQHISGENHFFKEQVESLTTTNQELQRRLDEARAQNIKDSAELQQLKHVIQQYQMQSNLSAGDPLVAPAHGDELLDVTDRTSLWGTEAQKYQALRQSDKPLAKERSSLPSSKALISNKDPARPLPLANQQDSDIVKAPTKTQEQLWKKSLRMSGEMSAARRNYAKGQHSQVPLDRVLSNMKGTEWLWYTKRADDRMNEAVVRSAQLEPHNATVHILPFPAEDSLEETIRDYSKSCLFAQIPELQVDAARELYIQGKITMAEFAQVFARCFGSGFNLSTPPPEMIRYPQKWRSTVAVLCAHERFQTACRFWASGETTTNQQRFWPPTFTNPQKLEACTTYANEADQALGLSQAD